MRAKPRRQYVEQPGGREFARQDEEEQRRKQDRHRILGEALGVGLAVLRDHPGKERNERGGERTLGKEAAEEIGEALRDEERVGHRPRAEEGGGQDIPDKAENPARHGVAADGRSRAQQGHEANGVMDGRGTGKPGAAAMLAPRKPFSA